MNFIGIVTLSIIFGLNIIHADGHSRIYRNSDYRSHIRRNIVSDGVLSSGVKAVQPVSTSLDTVETVLVRMVRLSISCQTNADCAQFGSGVVCVEVTALSVGICVPKNPPNGAPSMINGKNTVHALILSGLLLTLNYF